MTVDPAGWAQAGAAIAGLLTGTGAFILAWRSDSTKRAVQEDAEEARRLAEAVGHNATVVETFRQAVKDARGEARELRAENRQLRADLSRHRVDTERSLEELREAVDQCHLEKLQLLARLGAG